MQKKKPMKEHNFFFSYLLFPTISLCSIYSQVTCVYKFYFVIIAEPISFMDTPIFQNATENKDATIRCEVKGNPEPSVSWYYNGQQIICEFIFFFYFF